MPLHRTHFIFPFLNNSKFPYFYFFENSHFFKIYRSSATLWIWRWHCLFYILIYFSESSKHSGQLFARQFFSNIDQNMVNSTKNCISLSFCAGPGLPGLATVSVWQSCGKPSTKFLHGRLVECLFIRHISYHSFFKI